MSEHGKQQWEIRPVPGMKCIVIAERGMMHPFAHVQTAADKPQELTQTEYDKALLIAAAPDLLDALQGVIPYMESAEAAGLVGNEGCHWPVELVRAAIAKSTGKA